jgi:hypothetical protein
VTGILTGGLHLMQLRQCFLVSVKRLRLRFKTRCACSGAMVVTIQAKSKVALAMF